MTLRCKIIHSYSSILLNYNYTLYGYLFTLVNINESLVDAPRDGEHLGDKTLNVSLNLKYATSISLHALLLLGFGFGLSS